MNRCLAAFLALLFASITVSSACFAEPDGQATRLVRYDDLNLSTPEGVKALHRRVYLTANQVCLDASGPSPGVQVDLGCRADALTGALLQIPDAIAQQQSGKSSAVAVIDRSAVPANPENRRSK
jgi:UrcA family protein